MNTEELISDILGKVKDSDEKGYLVSVLTVFRTLTYQWEAKSDS